MSHDSAPPALHVGPRSIPIPKHISTEAQAMMAAPSLMSLSGDYPPLHDKQGWREHIATVNNMMKMLDQMILSMLPVEIERKTLGGVRVAEVTPPKISARHEGRVLMNELTNRRAISSGMSGTGMNVQVI
jgi:hypothetical protein